MQLAVEREASVHPIKKGTLACRLGLPIADAFLLHQEIPREGERIAAKDWRGLEEGRTRNQVQSRRCGNAERMERTWSDSWSEGNEVDSRLNWCKGQLVGSLGTQHEVHNQMLARDNREDSTEFRWKAPQSQHESVADVKRVFLSFADHRDGNEESSGGVAPSGCRAHDVCGNTIV